MGTEHQAHVREAFADAFGHLGLLHHAAAKAQDGGRMALLDVLERPHVSEYPVLRVLADGAGVV